MNQRLQDRTALITGAGRGIGRSLAIKLASEGARIVVNDLEESAAAQVVSEILDAGGSAVACPGSVTASDFGERFVAAAVDAYGSFDIIVNNAGYTWDGALHKFSDEQWQSMVDCHMTAPFRILRAAHPLLKQWVADEESAGIRRVRKIVNVSSMAGMFGNAGQLNYSAAKAGVIGMTKALAKEWGRLHVTANSVSFGLINTRLTAPLDRNAPPTTVDGHEVRFGVSEQLLKSVGTSIPMGRPGSTEEAAGAVFLLCIPESDYISGHNLVCSGGLTGF
jgi:3-oxoacyl-[acyl-carrier protein] reductase